MKTKIISLLLIGATLGFSGCGGTSSSSSRSLPTSPTASNLPVNSDSDIPVDTSTILQNNDLNLTDAQVCSAVPVTEVLASNDVLDNSNQFSVGILNTSEKLLKLSESLLDAGSSANPEYIEAMLRLSDDIGTMADRILDMADKILVMADDIGEMSERILETQRIQGENVKLTEDNIVASQKNLDKALGK